MGFKKLFRGKQSAPKSQSAPAAPPLPPPAEAAPKPAEQSFSREEIGLAVVEALRTVYDPEIPVNIYDMGLVYAVDADDAGKVVIQMTLTSPACPVAGALIPEIERKILTVPGVTGSKVILVWDPPWDPEMMTEAAKLQLGLF
jgi:FeS assembly SUF system protein